MIPSAKKSNKTQAEFVDEIKVLARKAANTTSKSELESIHRKRSKINPKNCNFHELMVLNVETGYTSPKGYLRAVVVRDNADCGSCFEKADYISYAQAVMEDYKTLGNWDSYLAMVKWVQSLLDYAAKNQK